MSADLTNTNANMATDINTANNLTNSGVTSTNNNIFLDITVMPSTLLRGTTLDKYHSIMTIPSFTVSILSPTNMNAMMISHFKNIYKENITDNSIRNVVHYLNSKKVKFLIFRKSRSKNRFINIDSNNDFNSLKSILKIKNKLKFVIVFVKVSTISSMGLMQVKNSVIEKLEKEFKLSNNLNNFNSNNSDKNLETVSIESKVSETISNTNTDTSSISISKNSPSTSTSASASSFATAAVNSGLPIDQLDNLVDTIKSYLDPVNIDKHLGVLLECINDMKNNLSTNIEPINQKLDGLCNTVIQLASKSVESLDSSSNLSQEQTVKLPPIRSTITHSNILCDGCDKTIVGCRFKCLQCHDYDLCEVCDAKFIQSNNHLKTHQMIRISLDELPILSSNVVKSNKLDNAVISFDGGLTSFPLYDTYSFELIDCNADPNLTKLLDAKIWIKDHRYLSIKINSTLSSSYMISLTTTFKNDDIPDIENLKINLSDAAKILVIDPFGPSVPTNQSKEYSLDMIEFLYLTVTSNGKEYLFEYTPVIDSSSSQIVGKFFSVNDNDINIDTQVSQDSENDTISKDSYKNNQDVSIVNPIIIDDEENENKIVDDIDEEMKDVNEIEEENEEYMECKSESDTESDFTPSVSNSTIESVPSYEIFHSAVMKDLSSFKKADLKHDFELLGYYLLDFNTNELEVRVRSTINLNSKELISLSILDFEGARFTSELVNQGNNILIARFPNWNYGDFQLEIREAIVHYKACDYDIFTNTVSTKSSVTLENPSKSSSSAIELDKTERSELIIPQLDTRRESEYVFISRTQSLVDDNVSDYSVLSMDEN